MSDNPKQADAGVLLWLSRLREFLILIAEHFAALGGPRNAAALTYTTLLSLVPLMTVTLAIFSAFPIADRVNELIQSFVFENFVPTSGVQLQQYLSDFSSKASQLTGTGAIFLVIVALLMMSTIDDSLNTIWEVKSTRGLGSKFLIYWTVLSLGPILIGVSLLVTSYAVTLPILSEAASSGVGQRLLRLTPVLTSAAAFTLMYTVIPNRRVRLTHALIGGVFAALLFEVAKHAFAYYITQFPTYEAIYGALAVIPIFLVWVYLSWIIVLLGAEVTHGMSIYDWSSGNGSRKHLGMGDALAVILALDEASANGGAPTTAQLARQRKRWREPRLDDLLRELAEHQWVHLTQSGGWTLARRLDDATLMDVLESRIFELPRETDRDWPGNEALAEVLRRANSGIHEALDVPLSQFRLRRAESVPFQRGGTSECE